jgi:hypothetical protein
MFRAESISLAAILGIVGGVLFLLGMRAGLGIFGLGMVANGFQGIRTRRISFARRGGRDSYEGSKAVALGVLSILVGLGLACWSAFPLLSGTAPLS